MNPLNQQWKKIYLSIYLFTYNIYINIPVQLWENNGVWINKFKDICKLLLQKTYSLPLTMNLLTWFTLFLSYYWPSFCLIIDFYAGLAMNTTTKTNLDLRKMSNNTQSILIFISTKYHHLIANLTLHISTNHVFRFLISLNSLP